MNIHVLMCRV